MPDETDAKKIITAPLWRTGGDHQDSLVLCGWRLSSKTWNPKPLPEWSNCPLWRLMSMHGITHC